MQLGNDAIVAGYKLCYLPHTTSTNDEALDAVKNGEAGPLWIVADQQSDGRGRKGRHWMSEPGDLLASLLLTEPCLPQDAAQLGFVTGLALHDALAHLAQLGAPQLVLKWPNDVLLAGGKAAGILLESHYVHQAFVVIIGIGVNLTQKHQVMPYPVASFGSFSRNELLVTLSNIFVRRFDEWRLSGFSRLCSAWEERAFLDQVTCHTPAGKVSGKALGLDERGRLKVQGDSGLHFIEAGDILLI